MNKPIVADASPLIAFGRLNQLAILGKLFRKVLISKTVAKELLIDCARPGASAIQHAIEAGKILVKPDPELKDLSELSDILGEGEATAIRLAFELQALLLIDEKLGRSTARKLQIKLIGTAGILLLAKRNKLIESVYPFIHQLKQCQYHLSDDLIKEVLKQANEL